MPALVLAALLLSAASAETTKAEECPAEVASLELAWEAKGEGIEYARGGWGKPVKEGRRRKGPIPVAFHLVRISLAEAGQTGGLTLRALRIPDRSGKVEEMVAWARQGGALVEAAVNGDYYPPGQTSRDPLGLLVSGGRPLAASHGTTGLLLDSDNRAHIGKHEFRMQVSGGGILLEVADMNRKAGRHEAVLYAGRYRTRSEAQWGCRALRLLPPPGEPVVNRTVPVQVVAVGDAGRLRTFQAEEYLLVACGKSAEPLADVTMQTQLSLEVRVPGVDWVTVEALSGGPRILRDGNVSIETRDEGLTPGMKGWVPKRHPRTAAGVSADGRTVVLLMAEGRLPHTDGMTAVEAACVMRGVGAADALLFDGGGSSSLLLGDNFVSKPQLWHNRSGRAVADTLAVVRMGTGTPIQEE